jgi:uncharacterized protein (TIGR01777 family)
LRILIIGATGFIGRALVSSCLGKNYQIVALVRNKNRAKNLLGKNVSFVDINDSVEILREQLEECDVVVNLSGKQLAGVRWTPGKKREFDSSRIDVTKKISNLIRSCENPPKVFVSASAVGVYGNRSTEKLVENSTLGSDYLSQMCINWETSAIDAEQAGTRVCLLRFGVVIGREGGILKQVMPGFSLGIGNYIGSGTQFVPWVHISDVVNVIHKCINDSGLSGPINVTAPNPATSKDFARKLANLTNARVVLPIPSILLRLVFGEGEKVLTNSQNAFPEKLIQKSFEFQFTDLESCLVAEVIIDSVSIVKISSRGNSEYLTEFSNPTSITPQYELKSKVEISSDVVTAFNFFSDASNLSLTTPDWMNFEIISSPDTVELGSSMKYRISLGFLKLNWTTVILKWDPSNSFVDWQQKGPYKLWIHSHQVLEQSSSQSLMIDRVYYSMPFGFLGRIVHEWFVKDLLKRIFSCRLKTIQLINSTL